MLYNYLYLYLTTYMLYIFNFHPIVWSNHCESSFLIRKVRRRMCIFIYIYLLRPLLEMK